MEKLERKIREVLRFLEEIRENDGKERREMKEVALKIADDYHLVYITDYRFEKPETCWAIKLSNVYCRIQEKDALKIIKDYLFE